MAGSIVVPLSDGREVEPAAGDRGALREILPVEPIRVLVAGSLLRRVGVSEVDRHARGQENLGVLRHLAALFLYQRRPHHLGQLVEVLDDRIRGAIGVLQGQRERDGEPCHPLHQRRGA